VDPAESVHNKFVAALQTGKLPLRSSDIDSIQAALSVPALLELARSQVLSRQLDRCSRKLAARGESFYTIASAGHEGMAAFAEALFLTDMAFLHYRDAAFQIHRASQISGIDPMWDILLSFAASSEDPISRGRHKVLGSKALSIPPQTSTIASHLPKAVGAAISIGLAQDLGLEDTALPADSVVLCSFGDASVNHSTALGAINHALWQAHQGKPVPIIFVCEDNGIGISTRTPGGWIEATYSGRPGLEYLPCDGLDLLDSVNTARRAAQIARDARRPVFVHMRTARMYGHAGTDVQLAYMTKHEIESIEANDPLLYTARILADAGVMTPASFLDHYQEIEEKVTRMAERAISRPKLLSSAEVMRNLAPPKRSVAAARRVDKEVRDAAFGSDLSLAEKPQHMARLLSWALTDLMLQHPEIIVAGEDVGPKGGVYNVTAKLHSRFGAQRVINTLLDEQSILGLGIGAAHNGILPITEIQFLAYVHNAEDQIRGEAATLSFFSDGQFTNPMVIRIAGLPYQKGFGGHFHNDNSLAVFRDIPGIVLAVPSNGADAVLMLRECVRLAREEQRVVVFVEPIALYMTRDLHVQGDGLYTSVYPRPDEGKAIELGASGVYGDGIDLAIVTYGNGCFLSRQAQAILEERGVHARVVDVRWLAPLNADGLLAAVGDCKKILIVDECRISGSVSEALMALFVERAPDKQLRRIAAEDSFIPLGKAAMLTLPSRDSIVEAALGLAGSAGPALAAEL
jgi:2-oxoisovalerate dehydrogenase E1 component